MYPEYMTSLDGLGPWAEKPLRRFVKHGILEKQGTAYRLGPDHYFNLIFILDMRCLDQLQTACSESEEDFVARLTRTKNRQRINERQPLEIGVVIPGGTMTTKKEITAEDVLAQIVEIAKKKAQAKAEWDRAKSTLNQLVLQERYALEHYSRLINKQDFEDEGGRDIEDDPGDEEQAEYMGPRKGTRRL